MCRVGRVPIYGQTCCSGEEEVNEENELWGRARVPKESAQVNGSLDILWRTITSSKKNLHNLMEISTFCMCARMLEFHRNVQDSKIIAKDSQISFNSRARSRSLFSSFEGAFTRNETQPITDIRPVIVYHVVSMNNRQNGWQTHSVHYPARRHWYNAKLINGPFLK